MLFGYLIVRTLLILVRALPGRPAAFPSSSQQSSTRPRRPFTLLTTWDPSAARESSAHSGMNKTFDLVVAHFVTSLEKDPDSQLRRGMHFPVGWDPYFQEYMTIEDVYHYATLHYDYHRRQLTLAATAGS